MVIEELLGLPDEADRRAFFARRPDLLSVTLARKLADEAGRLLGIDPRKADTANSTLRWLAEKIDSDHCRGLAARAEAALAEDHGNYQLGLDKYEEAIELFQTLGEELEEAITRTTGVLCVSLLGHHQRAARWAQKAREVFERRGDRLRLARLSLNYANILFRRDHWEEAATSYKDAHEVLKDLGTSEDVAVCLHNMAVCHTSMLDFGEAFQLYSEARSYCEQHGLEVLVSAIDYNIAYLFFLRGEYPEAIDRYKAARQTCLKLGEKYRYALCAMDEAEIFLELNQTDESEELATEAYSGFQELGIPYESGKALVLWAISLQRKGKSFAALDLLRQAREVFSAEGNEVWMGQTDLHRALILFQAGRIYEAAKCAERSLAGFMRVGLTSKTILCMLLLARVHVSQGSLGRARDNVDRALSELTSLDLPAAKHQAHFLAGEIFLAQGRPTEACDSFLLAHHNLERVRSHLQSEELKIPLLNNKLLVYERLFQLFAGEGRFQEAFQYLEKAKARTISDLVATRAHSLPARDTGRSDLANTVRKLREEMNWYYRQIDLQEMRIDAEAVEHIAPLRAANKENEERFLASLRELQTTDKELSSLQEAYVVGLSEIRSTLEPGTTLLEYYIAGSTVHAVVLTDRDLQIVPVTTEDRAREAQRSLRFQLAKFELGIEDPLHPSDRLSDAINGVLAELFEELVSPISDLLTTESLQIVSHDFLHHIPLHALVTSGNRYLGEQYSMTYMPSATVAHLCAIRKSVESKGAVVALPGDGDHPGIAIESIVDAVPDVQVLAPSGVSDQELESALSQSRIVHFSGRMDYREDNPMFSSLAVGERSFSIFDIFNLRLDAELVSLTGSGPELSRPAEGDPLLGLSRGFLFAGARSILLALWRPEPTALAKFMSSFFSALFKGEPKTAAFEQAVSEVRRMNSNPYAWAPFTLIGRP